MRIRVENGGNQKANFVHNNRLKDRETRRKVRLNIYALGYLCLTFADFGTESANCSARNPLIVRAEYSKCPRGIRWLSARTYADGRAAICGLSARSSVEKVKFSVSCTVYKH